MGERAHVVIVGAGFGGLKCAVGLRDAPVDVTVIDRCNHHTFQPLLYQVATAGLSPADIAQPIRNILRRNRNTEVILAEVTGIDVANKRLTTGASGEASCLYYDRLVIATGARHSYFGHPEWERHAPGLKTIEDATTIRRRILLAFESAETAATAEEKRTQLTFVIVGGGPTGAELAGSIAELAHAALAADFRHINPRDARVLLLEAGPRILNAFPPALSSKAAKALTGLGVEVRTGARVEKVDEGGVTVNGERIAAKTVLWAAGVAASNAARWLGVEPDRAGRVKVNPDLTVPGHPEIFVIGDTAVVNDQRGNALPGVAPVAMQEGTYVARVLAAEADGAPREESPPFRYKDKGNLATIGRAHAIADLGRLKLSGFVAWLAWLTIHIYFLIGFRNRVLVLIEWAWAYFTFQRGARLITKGPDS